MILSKTVGSFRRREISLPILLILFLFAIASVNRSILSGSALSSIASNSVILLALAVGQSFVIFTADIDVSVGSTLALTALVCGNMLNANVSLPVVFVAVLAIGAIAGVINGIGVAILKIPAIIMTLGMMGILRGAMMIYSGGQWVEGVPNFYKQIALTTFFGMSVPVWFSIFLLIAAYLVLRRTKIGRWFFAVGDNVEGARLVGIPVNKVKISAFVISGVLASVAGLVFVMDIGFVPNTTGSGMELEAIAAAVLGGVSLTGGVGSTLGAAFGALFLQTINTSLVYLKIPAYWNDSISGFLLLLIIVSDSRIQRLLTIRNKEKIHSKNNESKIVISSPTLRSENHENLKR